MLNSRFHASLIAMLVLAGAVQTWAQTVAPKGDEARLIAVLKSDAPHKEKVDACRQLGVIGGKDSVAPLAALLGDEKLSHNARYALEPNPDPAVNEGLRNALGKLKGAPLVGVIGSLGVRRDAGAVGALAGMLNDSDATVAQAAARALGSIGNSAAAQALQQALPKTAGDNKLCICEGMLRCAERLAAEGRNREAIGLYDQLRKLDEPHQVRGGALRGAILARGQDGLPLLREHLQSKDYILFSAAVQATHAMPGPDVTGILVDGMKGLPTDNQVLVIQTLGSRKGKAALPALFAAARGDAQPVRVAAIRALAQAGDASAVPVLVELLNAGDKEVAQAAQASLVALPGAEVDAAIMAMFSSGNADKQLAALDMISRRRMAQSTPALLKAAREGDARVRSAAIKTAGELADASQIPALLDLLTQVDASRDRAAVEMALVAVCTKVENSQAQAGALIRRYGKAEQAEKAALLRVLGAIGGPDALKTVHVAANSDDAEVRTAAIRALSTWKTAEAAPHLLALAKETNNAGERTLFLRGYLGLAGRSELPAQERVAMCRDAADTIQRDDEKRLLLGTLSNIESLDVMALIVPHLDNAGTRQEAAMAIVTVAEKLTRGRETGRNVQPLAEPLEKAIQATTNEEVAKRAKTALSRVKARTGGN